MVCKVGICITLGNEQHNPQRLQPPRLLRHTPLPPPPSPRKSQSTLISLSLPNSATSRLKARYRQHSDRSAESARQHNVRAQPQGWRTRLKHHLCSTSPVELLFGTTLCRIELLFIGPTHSFVGLITLFSFQTFRLLFPLLPCDRPRSLIRPRACHRALETKFTPLHAIKISNIATRVCCRRDRPYNTSFLLSFFQLFREFITHSVLVVLAG